MSINCFGEGTETLTRDMEGRTVQIKWNWSKFQTTEGYPLDDNMINWVIGQEQALNESFLCLDEWVHKLKHLERTQWYALEHTGRAETSSKNSDQPRTLSSASRRPRNRQVSSMKSIIRKTNASLQKNEDKN